MANPLFVNAVDSGATPIASGSASTILPTNSVPGNSVILAILVESITTGVVSSVVSSIGTFVKLDAIRPVAGEFEIELWKCQIVTGAATTVTITTTGGNTIALGLQYSGAGSISNGWHANASTGTSASLAVTPRSSSDAVVIITLCGGTISASPTGSWTNYNAGGWVASGGCGCARQTVTALGAVTATWTQSSADWGCLGVTLSPASASNFLGDFI